MAAVESSRARTLMRPYALLWLYRRRLRAHLAQELLAGIGVAIAVALVLASMVAAGSIAGSAAQVAETVTGPANLQLHARDAEGFPESLLGRVERLPGVEQAAPLLEQTATIVGPYGRTATVDLAGADISLLTLDGLAHTVPRSTLDAQGVGLSLTTARRLGIHGGGRGDGHARVRLEIGGRTISVPVSAVLGESELRALSQATVAVMPLEELQRISALRGRVSRILVRSAAGREAAVTDELRHLAGGGIEVASTGQDLALLRQALRPSNQASAFFAAVSSLLGLLLAFNALLLTIPERRRAIADLRLNGVRRTAVAQMLLFHALLLGLAASIVGLGGGYLLSVRLLQQSPRYLAEAFTLGSRTIVGAMPVLLALGAGLVASCLACAVPLLDLRQGSTIDAVHQGREIPGGPRRRVLGLACAALLGAAGIVYALAPALALACCILLAATAMLAVPLTLAAVLHAAQRVAARWQRLSILPLALSSLRAATLRSLALAGTGAVALFGSVALGGARSDLMHGIDRFSRSYSADAGIWIGSPSDYQSVVGLHAGRLSQRLAGIPGVAAVQRFQGTFMQFDGRRVWVLARPAGADAHLLASQVLQGGAAAAGRALARGGSIAVSAQIAESLHARIGSTIALPTPSGPRRLRIAATTTNLAWSPGTIVIGAGEYQRLWRTDMPTALAVQLANHASAASVLERVTRVLAAAGGGLRAATARQREAAIDALAGEGLGQLGDISTMLLVAAILAMAAALTSAIWQRRASLAELRLFGVSPARLRLILLVEAALMLGAGCLTGAIAGLCGQVAIDSYLAHVTGFPVASLSASARPLEILLLAAVLVLSLVSVPGWLASRVPPTLAFNE